ncbi:gag-protease polyprotein [Trifolium repens]|nr:gag-protease polyprotein [Trifolium repens]
MDKEGGMVEELIGSLLTCEVAINDGETQGDLDTDESINDVIVLLGRQFNKIVKRVDGRQKSNGSNIRFNISKQQTNLKKARPDEKSSQSKELQCHECEGHGHISPECPTYLRKQKRGMIAQWSDVDSSEGDNSGESAKQVTALTGVHISDVESEEDNMMTYEDLEVTYRDLLIEHD